MQVDEVENEIAEPIDDDLATEARNAMYEEESTYEPIVAVEVVDIEKAN